jgi:phosphosulfolactate phosphohydrolase-like enzyme
VRIEQRRPIALGVEPLGVAVVIDVFRATSTATVLAGRGVGALRMVPTPAALERLPPHLRGYLVISELAEAAIQGERIDNSPVAAKAVALLGRLPVLVTTNGTRALDSAHRHASQVLLASFLNLGAVARHLLAAAPERVTLVPAGKFERGEAHVEDDACAEALAELLRAGLPDYAALFARIRGNERVQRRIAREPGFGADVDLSLQLGVHEVVLRYQAEGEAGGWIRNVLERPGSLRAT